MLSSTKSSKVTCRKLWPSLTYSDINLIDRLISKIDLSGIYRTNSGQELDLLLTTEREGTFIE
jgi:hypothetical protein